MLRLSLRQAIVVVMLIVALVAGFIGADMSRHSQPGYSGHISHPVAIYCPPPPIIC